MEFILLLLLGLGGVSLIGDDDEKPLPMRPRTRTRWMTTPSQAPLATI